MMDFKELLKNDEYKFLNELIETKRVLFFCISGSYSHGTNTLSSDIDIRGIMLEELNDLVGISTFEQFKDNNTDTVIYSFKKFIELASKCNPSIIEMLFCEPKHYLYISELGQVLLDNRHLFLSKKAIPTFKGFARSQINRFENALVRNGEVLSLDETLQHINRSLENAMMQFTNIDDDMVNTYVLNSELVVDFNLKSFPLEKLRSITETLTNVTRVYNKQKNIELEAKDDYHFNKHMMHTIRLYYMLLEILETGDLHTYRTVEREELLKIKNGFYREADGRVKSEYYSLLESLEERINNTIATTKLAENVMKKDLEELILSIYKKGLF